MVKRKKRTILHETFESVGNTILETGKRTRQALKGVTPLPDSFKIENQPVIDSTKVTNENREQIAKEIKDAPNYTPLDHKKLDEGYIDQVRQKLKFLQQRQGEWNQAAQQRKQKEVQRVQEQIQVDEQKKVEQKQTLEEQSPEEPTTKKKRGLFTGLKKKREHAEFKPGSSKQ